MKRTGEKQVTRAEGEKRVLVPKTARTLSGRLKTARSLQHEALAACEPEDKRESTEKGEEWGQSGKSSP